MSNEQYKDDVEDDITDEQRTFQIFKEMADSVTRMLTWEYDIPEFHPDRMLPMLDLKMYVNKDTRGPTLMHSFYKKDMSSRYLIPHKSASSNRIKTPILVQEGLRRLRNLSPSSPLEDSIALLREYNVELSLSDYPEYFQLHNKEEILTISSEHQLHSDRGTPC